MGTFTASEDTDEMHKATCPPMTHKQVLLQTVKTQMKCPIMRHLIKVYTVCNGKKDHRQNTIIFETYNLTKILISSQALYH